MLKIERLQKRVELDKRTQLPYVLTSACPVCGTVCSYDLSKDSYLPYPVPGQVQTFTFYCSHDGTHMGPTSEEMRDVEWSFKVLLDVTLTEVR